MPDKLIDYVDGRDNNFNLLRFGAASAVFISHCPTIAGMGILPITTLLAYVAVNSFFVISGFLVASSFWRHQNTLHFLTARLLRIYPALILAVIYTILIGLTFSELPISDYLRHDLTQDYLLKNTTQLIWPIPETLPGLPNWGTANAPLWTLPFELHMYLSLLLLGSLGLVLKGRTQRLFWLLCFAGVAVATGLFMADYAFNFNGYGLGHYRYYLRFISMFGLGVLLFSLRAKVVLSTRYFVLILLIIALSSPVRILFVSLAYGLLAYVLLYLAYVPTGRIRQFNRLGDYSYGIYIFGYPTQKAVMHLLPNINAAQLFVVAFAITLLIAVVSWHFVEQPALKLKRNYFA